MSLISLMLFICVPFKLLHHFISIVLTTALPSRFEFKTSAFSLVVRAVVRTSFLAVATSPCQ